MMVKNVIDYVLRNYYNNYYYSDYSGYYGSGYFEDDIPKWYEFGKKMNIKKNRNKD